MNSIYAQHEILSLALTDLALRKIGLESLVMLCSNSMRFKPDFLNRVGFCFYNYKNKNTQKAHMKVCFDVIRKQICRINKSIRLPFQCLGSDEYHTKFPSI